MSTVTTEMNIDLNDMYIEDSGDVFGQLDDAPTEEVNEANALGAEKVEAEDLESEIDFEDIDGDEPEAEEADEEVVEDVEEVEEEEVEEQPDEEEVDFEQYEVTLPSGDVIKLHEAVKGYRDAQALQAERAEFEEMRKTFESSSTNTRRILELAKLEAQRVIEDYEGFDWATLSREDPKAYVENREFLDKYRTRHAEILSEMSQIEDARKAEEEASFRERARQANAVLNDEIPGWNKDLYIELMTYGVKQLGMPEDYVVNCLDPGVFKALYKARQLDEGKATVRAKIKKLNTGTSPKKVVKPAAKTTKPVNSKKAIITKKMATGSFDESDLADAFSLLED